MSDATPAPHLLAGHGWTPALDALFTPHRAAGLIPGRIARVDRGRCDVITADPVTGTLHTLRADTAPVGDPDPVRCPCTGDWAAVDAEAAPLPALRALLPRSTAIVRTNATKRSEGQVLAANVDTVLIAVSLAAEPDLGRVERFLALAWESGAQPLVALTKADLAGDAEHIRADVEDVAPGVTVLTVSAATGENLDVLAACLGPTTALIGQSGAGKSTLTNALAGAEVMAVQHVRDSDGKGRHTTTTRELIPLPDGGVLIDTPGLRGVGLYGGAEGISGAFSDVAALAAACRFDDCAHGVEPGCAVVAALADGTLAERRWESYRKLQRENAWIESRSDARLAAERRRRWKVLQKSVRDSGVVRRR
ncbi:ribosome small subunit-dependent GTPase A [Peterkaempfera bronchialis]|uniref:Small ribosomal subunit biogenesis GTPase RsgA n=1 Tax=Peterkaempfera bronchialis TaxID=2126346 RepID=A0A345STE1_9ACTN|nr:ribosome small subunit-dependent GTPase A [Peterkaempfera bronchialis]AXI76996.1 ribosome small subunit-dependent GTPase A [Peterkaempfera bronchialis]